jgi:hypothetical protein
MANINTHQTLVPKASPKAGLQANQTISSYKTITNPIELSTTQEATSCAATEELPGIL